MNSIKKVQRIENVVAASASLGLVVLGVLCFWGFVQKHPIVTAIVVVAGMLFTVGFFAAGKSSPRIGSWGDS